MDSKEETVQLTAHTWSALQVGKGGRLCSWGWLPTAGRGGSLVQSANHCDKEVDRFPKNATKA